jgi:hypothetical protein
VGAVTLVVGVADDPQVEPEAVVVRDVLPVDDRDRLGDDAKPLGRG